VKAARVGTARRARLGPPYACYWEHAIRDDADLERHVDYIHFNPVKHGLVSCVGDWPHSSFKQYVARGDLPPDWGGDATSNLAGEYGE
jgi:putative transposase